MKRLDPKLALDFSAPGPCRMACRVLAAWYRVDADDPWDYGPEFKERYAILDDAEKARVDRFQERIERLIRRDA